MNLYKTEKSAKSTIRKQALHLIPHVIKWLDAAKSGFYVEFQVELAEDVKELTDRGFAAILIDSK